MARSLCPCVSEWSVAKMVLNRTSYFNPRLHFGQRCMESLTAIRAKSQKFTNFLSISCLCYLKNYLRGTMGEERFNGLALMHAHRDIALNLDEIIDLLASLRPRRKRMANSLCIDDYELPLCHATFLYFELKTNSGTKHFLLPWACRSGTSSWWSLERYCYG